ncbi:unnamed protein product [Musa textilis]
MECVWVIWLGRIQSINSGSIQAKLNLFGLGPTAPDKSLVVRDFQQMIAGNKSART